MQGLDLARRFDAELGDQPLAGGAVGVECLGLAAGAVERQHELGAEVLAQRVGHDQLDQLVDHVVVAAQVEQRVDAGLEGLEPDLHQAGHLGPQQRLGGDVAERVAAPQLECGRHLLHALLPSAHALGVAAALEVLVEQAQVELVVGELNVVAGLSGADAGARDGPDGAPQAHDVGAQGGARSCGGGAVPDDLGQLVGGDDLIRPGQQRGQGDALACRGYLDHFVVHRHFQVTEHPEPHADLQ
ncbi:hypothetical protein GCM10020001_117860 [Nonomuraea salmonea]